MVYVYSGHGFSHNWKYNKLNFKSLGSELRIKREIMRKDESSIMDLSISMKTELNSGHAKQYKFFEVSGGDLIKGLMLLMTINYCCFSVLAVTYGDFRLNENQSL